MRFNTIEVKCYFDYLKCSKNKKKCQIYLYYYNMRLCVNVYQHKIKSILMKLKYITLFQSK